MDIEYLKRIKKQKKLTLHEISIMSGIPKRTVDDIFSGQTQNPRIDTLQAIERALGIENGDSPYNIVEEEQSYKPFIDIELWKKRKRELHLSYEDLSVLTQISQRQLYYIFGGNSKNPGIETVNRIERALGIEKENSPAQNELSEGEQYLIELFNRVPADKQEMVLQMIRAALEHL